VPGYLNCNGAATDGCEVNGTNDKDNCGACGNKCPGSQTCVAGACSGGSMDAGSDADPDGG
jgi:hypothetical protein